MNQNTTNTAARESIFSGIGWRLLWAAAVLAAAPLLTGCAKKDVPPESVMQRLGGETFPAEDDPRDIHRIFDVQAASGARSSSTLYAGHFDAGNLTSLNSLGEQKLDLMLYDDDALPLTVFLEVANDDSFAARKRSVEIYLRDRGILPDQLKVVAGHNPRTLSPTAQRVKDAQAVNQATAATTTGGGASGGMK